MSDPTLVTIDTQNRLVVSQTRHDVSWLKKRDEIRCVVQVVGRGVVRVWPLEAWAKAEGLTPEDAVQHLDTVGIDPLDPRDRLSASLLASIRRKEQRGQPVHELPLPDIAIFALFAQGEGPMAVRKGRREGDSGKALLMAFDDFFELWGQSVL